METVSRRPVIGSAVNRAFLPAKSAFEQIGELMLLTGQTIASAVRPPYPYGEEFIGRELQMAQSGDVLFELGHAARTDQHRRHPRVAQGPGDGHLREGLMSPEGDVVESPDAGKVVLVEHVASE